MTTLIDKSIAPFQILLDERNFTVVTPYKRPLKKKPFEVHGYFSRLNNALEYISRQKAIREASLEGCMSLKNFIETYTRIKEKIICEL